MNNLTLFRERPALSLFDEIFRDFDKGFFPMRTNLSNKSMPKVNTYEENGYYVIDVFSPGYKKEDFQVNIEDNKIFIRSEAKNDNEKKDRNSYIREYSVSSFERSFVLPEDCKKDYVNAKYENGVLKVEIPKMQEKEKKKEQIEVTIR